MEGLKGALRGNIWHDSRAFADKSVLINRKLSPATITVGRNARTIIRIRRWHQQLRHNYFITRVSPSASRDRIAPRRVSSPGDTRVREIETD